MHDLIDDDTVKAKAKEHIARIVGHIVEHNYQLIDVDGQPTVWGRWDPEYFASWKGMYASGLNGLEMLAYATTAAVLTGEPRFTGAVADLVAKGYPAYTIAQKHTVPAAFVNHSDDRLAFYAYLPLLNYEKDPALRGFYRPQPGAEGWEIERIEKNPWFNFIYGKLDRSYCEVAASVDHLRPPLHKMSGLTVGTRPRRDDRGVLPPALPGPTRARRCHLAARARGDALVGQWGGVAGRGRWAHGARSVRLAGGLLDGPLLRDDPAAAGGRAADPARGGPDRWRDAVRWPADAGRASPSRAPVIAVAPPPRKMRKSLNLLWWRGRV